MATGKDKSEKKNKRSLWKRIKKNVKLRTTKPGSEEQPDETTPFIQKTASEVQLSKNEKSRKRKKSLKKLKQYTMAACRYIGMGASISAHGYGQGVHPVYPEYGITGKTDYPYYF